MRRSSAVPVAHTCTLCKTKSTFPGKDRPSEECNRTYGSTRKGYSHAYGRKHGPSQVHATDSTERAVQGEFWTNLWSLARVMIRSCLSGLHRWRNGRIQVANPERPAKLTPMGATPRSASCRAVELPRKATAARGISTAASALAHAGQLPRRHTWLLGKRNASAPCGYRSRETHARRYAVSPTSLRPGQIRSGAAPAEQDLAGHDAVLQDQPGASRRRAALTTSSCLSGPVSSPTESSPTALWDGDVMLASLSLPPLRGGSRRAPPSASSTKPLGAAIPRASHRSPARTFLDTASG
mmetsp:Transcript_25287/g.72923  ORF Transcript_25287/g.72923 Transcript_25287/m.72923 type:complete len:296 (+) Transcript_25287:649-1536(+)